MNRKSILIIDENEDFINSSVEFLTVDMKVNVVTWATSVEEAVDKICKYKPGIIICDLANSDYQGKSFPQLIRSFEKKSKIIMTSFYDNADYRTIACDSGADGFITKDEFKESIAAILNYTYYVPISLDEFIFPLN